MHWMQKDNDITKFDYSFPRQVLLVFVGGTALAAYPLFTHGSADVIRAVAAGALLSLVNVLAGYAAIEYSFDKSYTTFLKAVLGGMGVRLLVMLGCFVVMIEVLRFRVLPLVASLFGFYLIYLILEVMFIQKKMNKRVEGSQSNKG
jgi:hypothetical protein